MYTEGWLWGFKPANPPLNLIQTYGALVRRSARFVSCGSQKIKSESEAEKSPSHRYGAKLMHAVCFGPSNT